MVSVLISIILSLLLPSSNNAATLQNRTTGCNVYQGQWVHDESYPLFDSSKCNIRHDFACLQNGRPDRQYLKYRWQPNGCNLPKFNGVNFLTKLKGKKVLFVGDSVSQNQWTSMVCLLRNAVNESGVVFGSDSSIQTVTFQKYGVSVGVFLSHYLVDIQNQSMGRVLNLDSITNGETWKQYDVLIFNTWLWWYRRGPKQPFDYIENNGNVVKDMDRMEAFQKGLVTWAKWVNLDSNPTSKIFFQGISPMHYNGEDWGASKGMDCSIETIPVQGSTYPGGEPRASTVLEEVLKTQLSQKNRVHLLDITALSQLRKDGHPGKYGKYSMDCTHWCVAGVMETWNQLLYAQIVQGSQLDL